MKKNFSWAFFSNIFTAFIQFITLVLIAKIGNPEMVGQYALGLAIVSPVFILSNLKLNSALITDKNNDFSFNEYYSLRTITNYVAITFVIAISLVSGYSTEVFFIVLLLAIQKTFESKSEVLHALLQKKELIKFSSLSLIIRNGLSILIATPIFLISKNLLLFVLCFVIVRILMYYFVDTKLIKNKFDVITEFSMSDINKKLFLLALPLGLSSVIGSLKTNVPRYLLEFNTSLYELGIFSAIMYFIVIGSTFLNAVSLVITPRLNTHFFRKEYKKFDQILYRSLIIGFIVGVSCIIFTLLFGDIFLTIAYSKEYAEYTNVLVITTVGALFLFTTVFLGTALTAMRRFNAQLIIHILSLAVISIVAILIIPIYGIEGASYSVLIGYFVTSIGYLIVYFNYRKKVFKGD